MGESNFLILHGVVGALIFSCVLFLSPSNRAANRFLAILILAIALNLGLAWILQEGLYNRFPLLHALPFGVVYGLAPLIYFYVWSLCKNELPNLKHLWWIAADYPHSLYHLIYGRDIVHPDFHAVLDKFGFFSIGVMVFYLWKSYRIIQQYQQHLPHNVSNTEHLTLKWLKQFIGLFLISIPISLVFWILLIATNIGFDDKWIAYGFQVVSVYWLGIGGIRQREVITRHQTVILESPSPPIVNTDHLKQLLRCMEEEKLYLMPDLSVRYLEDRLGLTSKQISEALNRGLSKNFYAFVNEYRVAEFKSRVAGDSKLTLAGLALECGFNSKTTFQRVFKEVTGERPTEFTKKRRE